jgi:ATP-dependent helicase/nuclease subunit B
MPFLTDSLKQAFAAGATVVTPNRRLARALVALHDRDERGAGRTAWPAVKVLPWEAWLAVLWQEALAAGVVTDDTRLRTRLQAAHAWGQIVAAEGMPLIDPRGAATLAVEAWTLVHAWGAGGDSWRAWGGGDGADDDCAAFARWANRYRRELQNAHAVDPAEFPDWLCARAHSIPSLRGAAVAFVGFAEFAPQQERLLEALTTAGANITRADTLPNAHGRIRRAHGATPRDEIARALAWAREHAIANPDAAIAIVIEDLAARRDEIRALADDILCPALQWPGGESLPRPYNLSLGKALSDVPLVAVALDLLGWSERALPLGRAAALLRSPFVAVGGDAWMSRTHLEPAWIEGGRATITMRTAIAALSRIDPPLAQRWAAAIDGVRWPASGSPREHADAWRSALAAIGWPGSRSLDSHEYQAVGAWDEALADFATLSAVERRMTRPDALATLRAHVASVIFQPESAPAPIQIAGLLEAAGQPFDALWLAGLAAERWPPAPRPNPMLPVAWQRERNVPRASAARELAYAAALTAQFACAAPDVVFSYPQSEDDHECTPSQLIPAGADIAAHEVAAPVSTAQTQFALRAPRELVVDDAAPPLAAGIDLRGGARLIEAQSDCPFKGMAMFRLGAQTWPTPVDGLSALERGVLVHAALAAFWRAVKTRDALVALSPQALRSAIAQATREAASCLPARRWRTVSPLVQQGEAARIESLITKWLHDFERPRPSFVAQEVEAERTLALAGRLLRLRLDRIDMLDGGGVAIIDYKTGRTDVANSWFETRPRAPQLGLYTLAQLASAPEQGVRAVAYAQLKPGKVIVRGLAADAQAWPELRLPSSLRNDGIADWCAMEARWSKILDALGAEIVAGAAAVSPRDEKETCARCGRRPLCRLGALAIEDREQGADA